jgi:hypothetical protein
MGKAIPDGWYGGVIWGVGCPCSWSACLVTCCLKHNGHLNIVQVTPILCSLSYKDFALEKHLWGFWDPFASGEIFADPLSIRKLSWCRSNMSLLPNMYTWSDPMTKLLYEDWCLGHNEITVSLTWFFWYICCLRFDIGSFTIMLNRNQVLLFREWVTYLTSWLWVFQVYIHRIIYNDTLSRGSVSSRPWDRLPVSANLRGSSPTLYMTISLSKKRVVYQVPPSLAAAKH